VREGEDNTRFGLQSAKRGGEDETNTKTIADEGGREEERYNPSGCDREGNGLCCARQTDRPITDGLGCGEDQLSISSLDQKEERGKKDAF